MVGMVMTMMMIIMYLAFREVPVEVQPTPLGVRVVEKTMMALPGMQTPIRTEAPPNHLSLGWVGLQGLLPLSKSPHDLSRIRSGGIMREVGTGTIGAVGEMIMIGTSVEEGTGMASQEEVDEEGVTVEEIRNESISSGINNNTPCPIPVVTRCFVGRTEGDQLQT